MGLSAKGVITPWKGSWAAGMNKSLSCQLGKHECRGEYTTPRGPKKGTHPCACECHARHIAPMLSEFAEKETRE